MHSKSQVSTEFLTLLGLSFLIALIFELVSLDQLHEFGIKKEDEAVKDLALKLQKELLIAATVEDGYVRIFDIPDNLEGINYSLNTQNSTITVLSKNSAYIVPIPNVVGNASKGPNIINKTGNIIYLNSKAAS